MSYYRMIIIAYNGSMMTTYASDNVSSDRSLLLTPSLYDIEAKASHITVQPKLKSSYINKIVTDKSVWTIFQSTSQMISIYLELSKAWATHADDIIKNVYRAYCQYCVKNYMQVLDQPIHNEKFDQAVMTALSVLQ